jgi:2-dehydropantoate 2-reductase
MGGLCFVCLNRIEPGVIRHIDHGRVVLGEFQGWPEPRTHDIATLFKNAGVPCSVAANLARAHWEKLAWNIPFNGLGVAGVVGLEAFRRGEVPPPSASLGECLTTDRLLMDPGWEAMAKTLIQEVVSVANRLGFDLSPSLVEVQIERTRSMGAYKASTLIDFERGQPLELQSIFLEPLAQARHAGVDTPWLQTLCKVLEGLDRRRVEAP